MASTSNEINDGVDRASTTSLIQSMENPQSQEENDNPHQAIKPVDKTEGPTGSLLAMPAEIRQQIFGYLLCADKTKNCPHDRSHYLFLHPECCRRFPAIKNRAFLAALLINRQLYFEIKYILYSQNLFYFEGCLTQTYFDPPSLPQKLIAAIGTNLKQIGFPLKFGIIRSITKDASIKAAERFKAEFKLLSAHLPNLKTTQVDLFCTYIKPCQRFLACLVHSCQLLTGKKIITLHSTNREKNRIAKTLKIHLNNCSDFLLIGGCVCDSFLEWSSVCCTGKIYIGDIHRSRRRNNFGGGRILCYQGRQPCWVSYESVASSDCDQGKGPRIGCLLCKLGTKCVHDRKYAPTRQAPQASVNGTQRSALQSAFDEWFAQRGKERKGIYFIINWN